MQIRIITLPFDDFTQGFADEIVADFCHNKKVYEVKGRFFMQEGRPYWSVMIRYDHVFKGDAATRDLDDIQKLLFDKLKVWRKEQAEKEGFPVYLIFNNSQLNQIITSKCMTLESLKFVKGFGRKKIDKYGKRIIDLVKSFYEQQQHP